MVQRDARRSLNLHDIAAQERPSLACPGNPNRDPLAGNPIANEHHSPVEPSDALPTRHGVTNIDDDRLANRRSS